MTGLNTEFDFDAWAKLAKDDPNAFESMREQMIQDVIASTSPEIKRRMEGLQWQIDQIRSTSANPMSSCLKISQMMWENVTGEDGLIDHMRQLSDPIQEQKPNKPKGTAKIINISDNNTNREKS